MQYFPTSPLLFCRLTLTQSYSSSAEGTMNYVIDLFHVILVPYSAVINRLIVLIILLNPFPHSIAYMLHSINSKSSYKE